MGYAQVTDLMMLRRRTKICSVSVYIGLCIIFILEAHYSTGSILSLTVELNLWFFSVPLQLVKVYTAALATLGIFQCKALWCLCIRQQQFVYFTAAYVPDTTHMENVHAQTTGYLASMHKTPNSLNGFLEAAAGSEALERETEKEVVGRYLTL